MTQLQTVQHTTRASKWAGPYLARYALGFACLGLIAWLWRANASSLTAQRVFGRYTVETFGTLIVVTYLLLWLTYAVASREALGGKIANFALMTIGLVLVFGLFELPAWFGWLDYRALLSPSESIRFTNTKPWDNPRNLLDRELLNIHRPYDKFVGDTPGDMVALYGIGTTRRYHADVQYDGNGFRNDHAITQASIAAIGDSFLEAGLVAKNDLLTTRLAQSLHVEVANLGQGGYGPQQESIVLRRYGLPLQPKIVLWFFFEGNDLLDTLRYQAAMQDWDATVRDLRGFPERSFTANMLLAVSGLTAPRFTSDSVEARRRSCEYQKASSDAERTIYFAYPGIPLTTEDRQALAITQQTLFDARQMAEKQGAQFLLVYVPIKYRVYGDLCTFPADGYGRKWQPNELPMLLGDWSKAQGIEFLDLTAPLREAAGRGELVYFADDGHWNGKAHAIVADALRAIIQGKGWIH